MRIPSLAGIGVLSLLLAPHAIAQQSMDDGYQGSLTSVPGTTLISRASCGTGSTLAAPFLGGNGFAGNMVDITIGASDMSIECLDVNIQTAAGLPASIDVWYCPVTCVGNDMNQLANWVFIGTATGTSSGLNVPSKMDIAGNGVVFSAGQTYGLYVDFAPYYNSAAGDRLNYTNGTWGTQFAGDDCDITTYFGKGTPSFSGSSFGSAATSTSRDWNGVLYTSTGPAGPAMSLGCVTGLVTADFSGFTGGGPIAIVYGPAAAIIVQGPQCTGLALDLAPMTPPIIVNADAAGNAQVVQGVGPAVCGSGILVQAVDGVTCVASNSAAL